MKSSSFDVFDFWKELFDRTFNPSVQGGGRERTAQAGAAKVHFDCFTVKGNQFDRSTVVMADIGIELLNQAFELFFC